MATRHLLNRCYTLIDKASLGQRVWSLCGSQQRRFIDLQEYQSKKIMSENGLTVQRFKVVESLDNADSNLSDFTCSEYVIKAQVLAGGRGKGYFKKSGMKGGVKLTKDKKEILPLVKNMLNDHLVTAQTTEEGALVRKVMVAEALDIDKEYYVAILLDRSSGGPVLVASQFGGVNIEEVAEKTPEAIHKFPLPLTDNQELDQDYLKHIAKKGLGLTDPEVVDKAAKEIANLFKLFVNIDATQIEINPFGLTPDKNVVCFDAKIQFDENASFRQGWVKDLEEENLEKEDPRQVLAKKYNLNFVAMDGNIGCFVNGAGLAMATMDIIHHHAGSPANFLDVGGGVTQDGVEKAFHIITQDPKVKVILVNIFGGIVNCETVAAGLIAAHHLVNVPLIVRLEGTNQKSAMKMLETVPGIITASDLDEAAQKAVKAALGS